MQNVTWVQGLSIGLPVSLAVIALIVVVVLVIYFYQKGKPDKPPSISTDPQVVQQVDGLYLPLQGSIKDPQVLVQNDFTSVTNLLIFRAQTVVENTDGTKTPFQFPSQDLVKQQETNPTAIQSAQNALVNPTSGGLYSKAVADLYNFPWPPEAGVQLLKQYENPNKPPANDINGDNPLEPGGPIERYQPNIKNAFVTASTFEGSSWGAATAYNTVEQTSSKVQTVILKFLKDGLVYVEVAGGKGGSFTTGTAGPVSKLTYEGGAPGILWAYAKVKAGTQWNVQLSSSGGALPASEDPIANKNAIMNQISSRDSFSTGGGSGSFLAGSEGGGTTQISQGPLQDPYSQDLSKSAISRNILLLAGGGGAASKNAQGGPAGGSFFKTNRPRFNEPSENNNYNGFPGGSANIATFQADDTNQNQTYLRNGISGGGGSASTLGFASRAGQSYTVADLNSDPRTDQSFTAGEKQFIVDTTTGAPLRGGSGTSNPPAGGGGGAGFAGGGAGTWNLQPAPQNQHGAGGGGSSQVSNDLYFRSSEGTPNANPFQIEGSQFTFNPTNYFLLGIPCQNEQCT